MFRISTLILSAWILLSCSALALAQDAPKVEVYGGYSALLSEDITLHGWQASVAGNVNKWFGLVAEFGGAYDTDTVLQGGATTEIKSRVYTYLFGPRFSRRGGRVTPFVHTLFGGLRGRGEISIGSVNQAETVNGFGMALGGGVDVKLSERFALRVIQADYLLTRVEGETTNNARLSAGLVIRF